MRYLLLIITFTLITQANKWDNINIPATVHQCKMTYIADTISNKKITDGDETIIVVQGSETTVDYRGKMIIMERVSDLPAVLVYKGGRIFIHINWISNTNTEIILKDGIRKNYYSCTASGGLIGL